MGRYQQSSTSQVKQTSMMNRYRVLVLISLFLFGFALITPPSTLAQIKPAERKQVNNSTSSAAKLAQARLAIDDGNATAVKAWAKSNAAIFASIYAEDALEFRPDGSSVRGRQQILDLVKASMQRLGPGVELTVKTTKVWLDGDTAYETGKSIYKYTQQGQPKTFETLFVAIWKKQRDGRWEIVVDMPVPPD